jgi:hypothetical protein
MASAVEGTIVTPASWASGTATVRPCQRISRARIVFNSLQNTSNQQETLAVQQQAMLL